MGSENSIINKIEKFKPLMNESFIIGITNKGIYNRSAKDFEKIKDNISIFEGENENINFCLDGNINVSLNPNMQNSICSCPAQGICKHIVISLLYLKDYSEKNLKVQDNTESEKENKTNELDYKELKSLTIENAVEIIGKKEYTSILNSIMVKNEAVFEYGEFLAVSIESQNAKVYFPKENSIQNALCSCKEKKMCKHKAYAIIAYMISELNMEISVNEALVEIKDAEEDFLNRIKLYVGSVLDTGLSSITWSEIKKLEKLYIQAYGMKLFNLAFEIRRLSAELSYYLYKNVSFSSKNTLNTLCIIYNRASGIQAFKSDISKLNLLVGKRKEESYNLDNIEVIGLGASCYLTKTKDLLINGYFYCKEIKSMLIMSTMRPMDNINSNSEYLYSMGILWSDELSFKIVSVSKTHLKSARLTGGKISSTKSTICNIKGDTSCDDIHAIEILDYAALKDEIKKKSFQYFEPFLETSEIYLLKVSKIENINFDKVSQKLSFDVLDSFGNIIIFEIKYSQAAENAIKYFEDKKKNKEFSHILGKITEKNDSLKGTFLSGILDGKVVNVFFKMR